MSDKKQQKGPCYLCGFETTKAYMGRHLLAKHCETDDRQECSLIKIEDESGEYWLFADIPVNQTLAALDTFLRAVWLECCGHASAFRPLRSYTEEFGMTSRIGSFPPGTVIGYEYDFGSSTILTVTFAGKIYREKQKTAVRILARNYPYQFNCDRCGKKAAWIDAAVWPNVMYCDACAEKVGEEGYLLPVVNSPRMGVCGYCGEFDKFEYKGIKRAKKNSGDVWGAEKRPKKTPEAKRKRVKLREIGEDNFLDAFSLQLAPGQERFVSHPVRSLAQAYVYRNQCRPFGIYLKDRMVGYVMVIYDYDAQEYDIWHMMIDEKEQGKGYGSEAFDRVIEFIRTKPFGDSDRVVLTCNKDNTGAMKLYESKGFSASGNEDGEEIEMVMTVDQA